MSSSDTLISAQQNAESNAASQSSSDDGQKQRKLHKINVKNIAEVRGAIDHQIHRLFIDKLGFNENNFTTDLKIGLGLVSVGIAVATYFLKIEWLVATLSVLFFALVLFVQYLTFFIEKDAVLVTLPHSTPQAVDPDLQNVVVRVQTEAPKRYSETYKITVVVIPQSIISRMLQCWTALRNSSSPAASKRRQAGGSKTIEIDVTQFFDANGLMQKKKLRDLVQAAYEELLLASPSSPRSPTTATAAASQSKSKKKKL